MPRLSVDAPIGAGGLSLAARWSRLTACQKQTVTFRKGESVEAGR